MTLPHDLVTQLQSAEPSDAWHAIFDYAWQVCREPIEPKQSGPEGHRRDQEVGKLDLYLSTAGWDLWSCYLESCTRTSTRLIDWWNSRETGRAVIVLDALSLREAPWLLAESKRRGFNIHQSIAASAELPPDTTPFAKALGFAQRSSLENNGAGKSHAFVPARTESTDLPWKDCAALIGSEPDWFFWHHWPDYRLHDHDGPGRGMKSLSEEVETHLTSDDFWGFVARLAEGRRLVITSDHGYANSGEFPDVDSIAADYLKSVYKSGRSSESQSEIGAWAPPIDLALPTPHGRRLFVNGRRKWKSAGGYPTLTHGGLTVLEVAVPFIELSR